MRKKLLPSFLFSLIMLASGMSATAQTLTTQEQSILDLAEELFSSLLSGGRSIKQAGGYTYRYYADTGAYVGFKDGVVYTAGGPFGNTIGTLGPVSQVTVKLDNYKAKIELDAEDIDVGDDVDITGEFDLTIDGTVSTVVSGFATPAVDFSVTIDNIAAPDPTDTDEITDTLIETLENVEGIEDLEVVVTNNTSSRITFTVAFSATQVQSGVSVTVQMELEYDYVK